MAEGENKNPISDLCKFGDLIITLNKKTDDIKDGLYNIIKVVGIDETADTSSPDDDKDFSATKLILFSEPSLKSFVKNILKKFPAIGDISKVSGYEKFVVTRKDIMNELKPIYEVLTNAFEFQEVTLELLLQYDNLANFKNYVNYELMENYLELFVNFIFIHLLLNRIGREKIPIIVCYADAFQSVDGIEEKSYKSNLEFLKTYNYNKFYSIILEKIEKISSKTVLAVLEMRDTILQEVNFSAELLQNSATLSLAPEMSGINTAQASDEYLYMIRSIEKKISFIIVTGIFCPIEAMKQQLFVDIFKSVASYQLTLRITRDELFIISDELENVAKANSKAGKFKAAVSDTLNNANSLALPFHKERRDYIRNQLKQTLCVFEKQEYFGKKFQVILATLGIAKFEIFWYFSHYEKLYVDTKKQNSKQPKKSVDINIIELISLVHELCSGILQDDKVLDNYFAKFVAEEINSDAIKNSYNMLKEGNYLSDNVIKLYDEIYSIAATVTADNIKELNTNKKLANMHIDWIRIQLSSILPKAMVVDNPELDKINDAMKRLSYRIRMTMDVNNFFEKLCGLKEIFYFKDNLFSHLQECLDTKYYEQARYVGTCGLLTEEFLKNVSPLWPKELKYLSAQSIKYCEDVFTTISNYAASILHKIALKYIEYEKQSLPEKIVSKLEENKNRKNSGKRLAPMNNSNVIQSQVKPGNESLMKNMKPVNDELANNRWMLRNLVYSLSISGTSVYNTQFNPHSYLTEALAQAFRDYLGSASYKTNYYQQQNQNNNSEDSNLLSVKRPSELLSDIKTYLHSLNIIDGWVNIGCSEIMTNVLVEELDPERSKKFFDNNYDKLLSPTKNKGGLDMFRHGGGDNKLNVNTQPILVTYAYWYSEFVSTKSTNGSIVISLSDNSLVGRPPLRPNNGVSFPIDEYASLRELSALSELVGSEGINYINEKLIKILVMLSSSIKTIIADNQEALRKISECADDDVKLINSIKQLKLSQDVYEKIISFGFIYEFRLKMYSALAKVAQENTFFIYDSIRNIHTHYPMNIHELPEYQDLDILANNYGMLNNVDYNLKEGIKNLCNMIIDDSKIWTLLPSFFTAIIYNICYQDGYSFNPALNCIDNNAQCIATTFNVLTTNVIAIISQKKIEAVSTCQQQFINMVTLILMKLKSLNPTDKECPKDLDTSWYILKSLISKSEFISISQTSLNYALIQLVNSKISKIRLDYLERNKKNAVLNPQLQANEELMD